MRELPVRLVQLVVVAAVIVGCLDGTPEPPCLEGIACVEAASCVVDADCDDGAFCNGVETCDADLGCVAGPAPTCDDGLDCTADRCDETLDACSFASSVPTPSAPEPREAPRGEIAWTAVELADGQAPTYDVAVDDSCDPSAREACGMESPEVEVRDLEGTTFAGPDLPRGATFRVRACHPCTGECGPWSTGSAVQ